MRKQVRSRNSPSNLLLLQQREYRKKSEKHSHKIWCNLFIANPVQLEYE